MRALPFALVLLGLPLSVQAGPLNDTGIDFCRDHTIAGTDTPVTSSTTCTSAQGGQDARYGRDPAAARGAFTKIGGGSKGFDFTKIANNGNPLSAGTALGSGATDWACTFDNNTGLMWEVKTLAGGGGLRDASHTYTWYDSVHNYGGNAGTPNGGSCTGSDCDTQSYVAAVNTLSPGLCNHNDWRMPTVDELSNLADIGIAFPGPTIDATYFPNTPASDFWSGSPYAGDSGYAWVVYFSDGGDGANSRNGAGQVRLVRAGQ
jgi:hypothetical protein